VKADILARLNDEYPASRHNTAWVLDEARSDPPRRREHWRRGDARARQKVLTAPLRFAVVDEFPVTWICPPVTWWPVAHWVYVCRRQPWSKDH
jgi:hypothetical protein